MPVLLLYLSKRRADGCWEGGQFVFQSQSKLRFWNFFKYVGLDLFGKHAEVPGGPVYLTKLKECLISLLNILKKKNKKKQCEIFTQLG